jgi:uncharacterized protein (DUF488 family)
MRPHEADGTCIYTIGHGNRALAELTHVLDHHHIGCVIDVRAHPGSRRYPYFSRAELAQSLPARSVEYVWEGDALGGSGGHRRIRQTPRLET